MDQEGLRRNDVRNDFTRLIKEHIDEVKELYIFVLAQSTNLKICKIPTTMLVNNSKDTSEVCIYFEGDDIWLNYSDQDFNYLYGEDDEIILSSYDGSIKYIFTAGEDM